MIVKTLYFTPDVPKLYTSMKTTKCLVDVITHDNPQDIHISNSPSTVLTSKCPPEVHLSAGPPNVKTS
jgi:hypothetical protein